MKPKPKQGPLSTSDIKQGVSRQVHPGPESPHPRGGAHTSRRNRQHAPAKTGSRRRQRAPRPRDDVNTAADRRKRHPGTAGARHTTRALHHEALSQKTEAHFTWRAGHRQPPRRARRTGPSVVPWRGRTGGRGYHAAVRSRWYCEVVFRYLAFLRLLVFLSI